MTRARRVDANQPAVVRALRAVGATVQDLSAVGGGCPDLLVGWRGINLAVEVKDGRKPPSQRPLTPDEERWHATWRGRVNTVLSVAEALALLGIDEAGFVA